MDEKTFYDNLAEPVKFSIVIPCYNEEKTLAACVEKVMKIAREKLTLEIIIVDDASSDASVDIARELGKTYREIRLLRHDKNMGKGAALRTGFKNATGDFVAVQDADLEYNPEELRKLLIPLIEGDADVVLGSRFSSSGPHRVLYFWHYMGNRFLTFLSNMLTDLNLTDMETCYKVFRRDIIQNIDFRENRFGFEPEIVARIAHMRLRIYEMGISYRGRTYAEGKKIGVRDGFRALYCILRYNAHKAPLPVQFLFYLFIGGFAAIVNLAVFMVLHHMGVGILVSTPAAFVIAAIVNYALCLLLLFRHKAKWSAAGEIAMFALVVALVGLADLGLTRLFLYTELSPLVSKSLSSVSIVFLNFTGRRFAVFPEPPSGDWKPQDQGTTTSGE